eukprot:scaffold3574_cov49-Attheya_sp.AAC.1
MQIMDRAGNAEIGQNIVVIGRFTAVRDFGIDKYFAVLISRNANAVGQIGGGKNRFGVGVGIHIRFQEGTQVT